MNAIVVGLIMVTVGLTVISNEPAIPLKSLCVMDKLANCWINEAEGQKREIQEGDYVIGPEDMNRILEKLKSVQK